MKLTRGSGIGILPPSRYYDLGEEGVWATYKKSPGRHLFRVQTRTGNPMGDPFLRFRKKEFGFSNFLAVVDGIKKCLLCHGNVDASPHVTSAALAQAGTAQVRLRLLGHLLVLPSSG